MEKPAAWTISAFKLLEHGAGKLLDAAASETGQMDMIAFGLDLVIMLFALQVHQIEFIDQPQLLEQIDGAIHRGTVDVRFPLAGQFEKEPASRCSRAS